MGMGPLERSCYFRSVWGLACPQKGCSQAETDSLLSLNNEAGLVTSNPPLPSILGDGVYTECQLLVRAAKHKDLQKVLSHFEAVLFTLCISIAMRASWHTKLCLIWILSSACTDFPVKI